ncbi:hypothetical protein QC762_0024780 [Podospora pseudocomata]|uniref:Uncharacterized protein n=1 Tax=Podospora pseudocomata TaxID=2093779 RepID=A0ABR0GZE6_9PEZI|nr:hypothetical protein QC762_0024780 [Podospora pseudocomata]
MLGDDNAVFLPSRPGPGRISTRHTEGLTCERSPLSANHQFAPANRRHPSFIPGLPPDPERTCPPRQPCPAV